MSDLDEIRRELDELRDRVITLEDRARNEMYDFTRVLNIARAADRNVSRSRSEVVESFAEINSSLAQITALLTSARGASGEP